MVSSSTESCNSDFERFVQSVAEKPVKDIIREAKAMGPAAERHSPGFARLLGALVFLLEQRMRPHTADIEDLAPLRPLIRTLIDRHEIPASILALLEKERQ